MDNVNAVIKHMKTNKWWIEEKELMCLIWRGSLKRQVVGTQEGISLEVEIFKWVLNEIVGMRLWHKRINEFVLRKESKEARSLNWRSLTWSRTLSQKSLSDWGVQSE